MGVFLTPPAPQSIPLCEKITKILGEKWRQNDWKYRNFMSSICFRNNFSIYKMCIMNTRHCLAFGQRYQRELDERLCTPLTEEAVPCQSYWCLASLIICVLFTMDLTATQHEGFSHRGPLSYSKHSKMSLQCWKRQLIKWFKTERDISPRSHRKVKKV